MAGRNYVFVSDLHLSEGFLEDKKCYHVNEDFFYDDAFARFLEHLEDKRKAKRYKKPWRLVINGDFLDFLQVTTAPDPEDRQAVAVFKKFVEGLKSCGITSTTLNTPISTDIIQTRFNPKTYN